RFQHALVIVFHQLPRGKWHLLLREYLTSVGMILKSICPVNASPFLRQDIVTRQVVLTKRIVAQRGRG
ncbi:hypothetical protein KAU37_11900, partial [Candidatus Bipolaricaulota bacterium]|nr:hypothetical protein [Candidatus Bipolaricaulota bacterium]